MKKYLIAALGICLLATSCKDFLVKENPNAIESEFFFSDETSLQIYTNSFVRTYSTKLIDFINGDRYSDTQSWDSEYKYYTPKFTIAEQTSWSWTNLRSINYYLENMRKATADEATLNHYEGVGRFFRALFYIDKLQTYGAVPWYGKVIDPTDQAALYQERQPRSVVAQRILNDLDTAALFCSNDSKYMNRGTVINKYIANAIKARFCLFEGTYRKYHDLDPTTGKPWTAEEKAEAAKYLNKCVEACDVIMSSGKFALIDDAAKRTTQYRDMFINKDACANCAKEWIWARDYDEGYQVNNTSYSINDYMINAQHAQYAFNRDFLLTYLMIDGTPFTTKYADYKEDPAIGTGVGPLYVPFDVESKDRDYRYAQTVRTPGFTRAGGSQHFAPDFVFSKTGYQPCKWLTDEINDEISGATYTDVPLCRYAEILLSWAEAKQELVLLGAAGASFTDADWAKSVGAVRARAGITATCTTKPGQADPYMKAYFLNRVDDPVILEIRRERGCEFPMENLRQDDDMRWNMGELLVRQKTGMYIPVIEKDLDLDGDGKVDNIVSAKLKEKAGMKVLTINLDGSSLSAGGHVLSEGDHGYVKPFTEFVKGYKWEDKKYLRPIPNVSVTKNEKLTQNAGWTE